MTTTTQPVWTDEAIDDAALLAVMEVINALRIHGTSTAAAAPVAEVLRHFVKELKAAQERIALLESAAEWVPMEAGRIQCASGWDNDLTIDGRYLVVNAGTRDNVSIELPSDVRLCRLQPQQASGEDV